MKICVATGTRAEYGLLKPLIEKISANDDFILQLLVTGAHLSPEFGLTYREIEVDGYKIDAKVEMLLSSDTAEGITKSMGLGMIGYADALKQLSPDLLVILGDRYEMLAVASTALIFRIPIVHIHGGELTEGAYDDAIRHAITKMSHIHFTATEAYRKRVIQLGENPNTVFNVGAIGLDNIKKIPLLSKADFENAIGRKLAERNFLVTFHPATLEDRSAGEQFQQLLEVLSEMGNTLLIFTKPNSDRDGRVIIKMIDEFVTMNRDKAVAFTSLGQLRYLSAIQYMDAVVGNSSSGIIEVPAFNVPTVNIGDRQKGRIMGASILNCQPVKAQIRSAIKGALDFDKSIQRAHPYGDGNTSDQILSILKSFNVVNMKKKFFDID